MKFILIMTLLAAASSANVERREKLSSIDSKKHGKRGVFGLGYGHHHEHGGQIYGPPPAEPAPIYETGNPPEHGYPVHPESAQPPVFVQPVVPAVPVSHPVPQPVPHPYPVVVPIIHTVTKHVAVAVPVPTEKIVHVPVEKIVHVPVHVAVPKPYPVTVEKYIDRPYPVHVAVPVHVPKPYPVPVAIHTQYKAIHGW